VNQEESEQNEVDGMKKGADTTSKVMQAKGEEDITTADGISQFC